MLQTFSRGSREIRSIDAGDVDGLADDVVWLDLREPTVEETRAVERRLGIEMPTREEMREIEASARAYEEGGALYLTATVLFQAETLPPRATDISFILKGDRLVTMRFADPQPFRTIGNRLGRYGAALGSAQAVFFWLLDGIVARVADVMERAALDLEELSDSIFGAARKTGKEERPDLLEALERIGRNGATMSKASESLHTLQRILLAVGVADALPQLGRKDARLRAKALTRDVLSLTDQLSRINTKIDLLLNATLGLINIEQNAIIKIFSVVAVVFLPPTLIASIYGMNFEVMPELTWPWGYPLALLLMLLSAITPFAYFKRKGWL
jgi:magnesium transporter